MIVEPAIISSSYLVTHVNWLFYLVCSVLSYRLLSATQPHKPQNEILGTIKNDKFLFLLHDFKKYVLKYSEIERKSFLLKKLSS